MINFRSLIFGIGLLVITGVCFAQTNPQNAKSGGETTVFNKSNNAFAKPAANLPIKQMEDFSFGNRLFNTNWVIAPASTSKFDGLGPLFNRVSCSGCHVRDGRGAPPEISGDPMNSMLIRLSIPGKDSVGGPNPHPEYGGQLNDRAIPGVPAEGRAIIQYEEIHRKFADGETFTLLNPHYTFKDLRYSDLEKQALFSPRVAPAVYGVGLLEVVDEQTILGFADPEDKNGDGISGRPNYVWDSINKKKALGRFGWKSNQPSVKQQAAGAFLGDIGITTELNPEENATQVQKEAKAALNGGSPELSNGFLDEVTFYLKTLAVPARRDMDNPAVQRGERIFAQANCISCHVPTMTTGVDPSFPWISNQKIHPFTDLLLHDMGTGLADNRPDFEANGNEWRTAPLWGAGLIKTVNGHSRLLHDGRARNFMEAILWHGGEAEQSKEYVMKLNKNDRDSLIQFLESL